MKRLLPLLFVLPCFFACTEKSSEPIDREALVCRNNVKVHSVDSLASLSLGNGNFAMTMDATGLQSFPESYKLGVPLGTQSQWGWHSFPNKEHFRIEETLKAYDFRGKEEWYACQFKEKGRQQDASNYFRANPHRLHLGYVGLEMKDAQGQLIKSQDIQSINQCLDLWNAKITSTFQADGSSVHTQTVCHPEKDMISASVHSSMLSDGKMKIKWSFPYPSGKHSDDASDWSVPQKHHTNMLHQGLNHVLLERKLDEDTYYVVITWEGSARFEKSKTPHTFYLTTTKDSLQFSTLFLSENPLLSSTSSYQDLSAFLLGEQEGNISFENTDVAASTYWNAFWKNGGIVDFSQCTDPRAKELERRVVLSQYLTAIQCAGMYPPQETGLTYNSWFGKYHLEMHWWHGVHFALWGREDLMQRSLDWYYSAMPNARSIAKRQGFDGVRWMKMTDPSAIEAPSNVGSFLIWQQPHVIYMAELLYRNHPEDSTILNKYKDLVFATATFMADFVDYDGMEDRYIIKGAIPAQETLRAAETINPPFELSYFYYALKTAQQWRVRLGMQKNMEWEIILDKLSPLTYNEDKLYLAAETATDTYLDTRYTSDHMAVLGALGVMPASRLVRKDIMTNTFNWIWDNWNWGKTWGWDYPMTAMCAARLDMPDKAVDALLMDRRTNTYLVNGHNYQDSRLRIYLPGNGGLLTAVAMMCAGWDGSQGDCPGFPKDGQWNVKWEGLQRMP